MTTPTFTAPAAGRGNLRQPKTLYLVAVFELAERFSFFGMLAILLYYVYFSVEDGGLGLPQAVGVSLVGAYSGCIYVAAVLGGWLADRILGPARTLLVGSIAVILGHISLALLPGVGGLITGMVLIAVGSGCTKPTTVSIVGSLYAPGDSQRIVGFSIFYLSLNIGAFIGGTLTGFLQQSYGFHVGFGAAALGMAIALAVYVPTLKHLPSAAKVVVDPAPRSAIMRSIAIGLGVVALATALLATGLIRPEDTSTLVAVAGVAITIVYLALIRRSPTTSTHEFRNVVRYLPIFIASVAQVALWVQLYTSVSIHAEARVDRVMFGLDLPPSSVVASGALFGIILAPIVNAMWSKLGARQPGTAGKYALSLAALALCFAVLGATAISDDAIAPVALLIGIVGGFYLADLFASPAGLSYAAAVAPAAFRTQMVTVHSLSFAIGSALGGVVGQLYNPESGAGWFFFSVAGVTALLALALVGARRIVVPDAQLSATPAAAESSAPEVAHT